MASPYFSSMNLPQQDFSVLQNAGRAWGDAYQQAGKAIGEIGSAYFKRRGMEKQASQFIKSKMGKEYLKGMGWDAESIRKIDDDPKEAEKLAYDAIREAGGVENVEARMFRSMQEQRQAELEQRQNYLFERQKQKDEGTDAFYKIMGSETSHPDYVKTEEEISGLREQLKEASKIYESDPTEENRDKISLYFDKIGEKADALNKIPKTIPMYQASSKDFQRSFPATDNPYTNMLASQHIQKLRENEQKLGNPSQIKTQLENMEMLNDQNAETFIGSDQLDTTPVLGKDDAIRRINKQARERGVRLDESQIEQALSAMPVVTDEYVTKTKSDFYKKSGLEQDRLALEQGNNVLKLLQSGNANPVEETTAIVAYAKILQPTGILTEPDIQRVGGSPALLDQFNQALQKADEGTLTEDNKKILIEATKTFQKILGQNAYDKIGEAQLAIGNRYEGLDMSKLRKRHFETDYKMIPERILQGIEQGEDSLAYEVGEKRTISTPQGDVQATYVGFDNGEHIFKDKNGNFLKKKK